MGMQEGIAVFIVFLFCVGVLTAMAFWAGSIKYHSFKVPSKKDLFPSDPKTFVHGVLEGSVAGSEASVLKILIAALGSVYGIHISEEEASALFLLHLGVREKARD